MKIYPPSQEPTARMRSKWGLLGRFSRRAENQTLFRRKDVAATKNRLPPTRHPVSRPQKFGPALVALERAVISHRLAWVQCYLGPPALQGVFELNGENNSRKQSWFSHSSEDRREESS
ncbi:hypothetical protein SKAU_G00282950 [Synaphobranchus kaupii]|uniref:Uncharacterized protein n=1 Tax=Synaphobranchus kaupii TaxID=118154 RepID=A0A9Q1EXE6_SYNKA|nr:hypothetical protein SKAU_G00282950 [Synaphobranchus kaupii]